MNVNPYKSGILFILIILIVSGTGCVETPVKVQTIENSEVLKIEGQEQSPIEEVDNEWEILSEEVPQLKGVDFFKNEGYGITRVEFYYSPASGMGILHQKKINEDWLNKSRSDYHVSGIRLLFKKDTGDVYDPGMITFRKDENVINSISMQKDKFVRFRVEEVMISPGK